MNKLFVLFLFFFSLSAASSTVSLDEILVRTDAVSLKKFDLPEQNAHEIYYIVNLQYPEPALTNTHLEKLNALGWSKCSTPNSGWVSFIDGTQGIGKERGVFQNVSYWHKEKALLMIAMKYYTEIGKDNCCLEVPDNTQQQVFIVEYTGSDLEKSLGLTCK
jgi:hypothetical protein